MEILSLTLANFRNFAARKFIFDRELTVIIGPNGSGKSNILEAISLLSGMKSVRVATDLDLVRFGQSEVKIEGRVAHSTSSGSSKSSELAELVINFQVVDELHVKRAYFIDSIKKRLVDFLDYFSVIEFSPLDLDLVVGSPALRRHHLDVFLASLDRDYWRSIAAYHKIIVRRNRVLTRILERLAKPAELDFWDERLLEHGKVVSDKRQDFFEFLNMIQGTIDVIASPSTSLGINSMKQSQKKRSLRFARDDRYGFSWQLRQSLLSEEKLSRNRERDIAAGMTLSGPHRDDFQFFLGGRDLEFFGSRGEQRMAVLALKLAELEYFAVKRGARPVLALDDIFSELDWEHREAVLSIVDKQQTIITAAERDSVPKKILKRSRLVELNH